MNDCISVADIKELGWACLNDFDRRVAGLPKDMCAPFHEEARQLETELLGLYRTTVCCVRREPNMDCVAKRWGEMGEICDQFLVKLRSLHEMHPSCGADLYYNRVLDLRNKCNRLKEMHQ